MTAVAAIELADTLTALVDGLPPAGNPHLALTSIEIEVPLEVRAVVEAGRLVFLAAPPHTRFRTGLLPPVQRSRLVIDAVASDDRLGSRP